MECAGKTYRFSQYNADGDKYFIVAGLPNGAVINLPEKWTVDTDGRAVTVSDASKSAQLASDSGVRISGACTITVNYAGITFVARQVSSGNEATTPETYTVTRWELSGGQLVVEYKSSSGAVTTARFTQQTSDGDKYFIVDGLPADTTINLPENWAVDTDGRAVTVSDTSKVSKLAPADGVRITGACTITAIYDGIMFTARQIQKSTRWELVGNELIVDCAVTTYRFQKYNADGDEYFIVKDIPNGAEINLPAGWTVDTDKRAVTVSDTSKVSQLTDEYGVRISGACTIMVNYAGITFVARQLPSGYRDTYVTTRWEVVNNELVVEYKASSGSENTAKFQLQTLNGDNMYIVAGLPENITINLPANWAVDTDGRAVTVSDASKVSRLADADSVRIAGACAITVNYDGITFTARQVHTVTRWEVVGNNLVIEYSGNTYTFPQMSALIDEYGVRIAGQSTITVNYSGITFTARRVHNVTRWEVFGNELIVECAGSTYSFVMNNTDGDEYFLVDGLPNGAVIDLPDNWILDTDGRAITVNDVYKVSPLADEYGVRIAGSCSITINYSGITFTARQIQNVERWEISGNELLVECSGNTYNFTKDNADGDEYFLVKGLPNGTAINLPEGWTVDTDGRAVTVSDPSTVSALSDEYGIKISGPCTITINYSGITLTVRQVRQNPDTQNKPEFKSASLILSGQIGVNFFLDLPEISGVNYYDGNICYMDFDINGDNTSNVSQLVDDEFTSNGRYGFRCYVNSVQMADPINATFHYGNNRNVSYTYTAERYLNSKLKGSGAMRDLAAAIKDYGHYAQIYLSNTNGWVLGDDHIAIDAANTYTASDFENIKQDVQQYKAVRDDYAGTGVAGVSYSLSLASETMINLAFRMASGYSGNVFASLNGGSENMAVLQPDGRYLVEISGIAAHQLGDDQNVTVSTDGANDFTVRVSALTFSYNTLNSSSSTQDKRELAAALYNYYEAAMNYRNSQ